MTMQCSGMLYGSPQALELALASVSFSHLPAVRRLEVCSPTKRNSFAPRSDSSSRPKMLSLPAGPASPRRTNRNRSGPQVWSLYALDIGCHTSCVVGAWIGEFVHPRRIYTHPAGGCAGHDPGKDH